MSQANVDITLVIQEINMNFYEYYGQSPFYNSIDEFKDMLQKTQMNGLKKQAHRQKLGLLKSIC